MYRYRRTALAMSVAMVSAVLSVSTPSPAFADLEDVTRDELIDADAIGQPIVGELGAALVTGDWNADGFADLAIGAPGDTVAGDALAGSVAVVWGTETGPDPTGATLITLDDAWIEGAVSEPGDRFGTSLAVGDLDGDMVDDLAIGAPSDGTAAGSVVVLYGADGGFDEATEQIIAQAAVLADSSEVPETSEPGDRFGHALAIGDLDDDGVDDLVVGAPGEDLVVVEAEPEVVDTGLAIVLFGSADETDPGVTAVGALVLGTGVDAGAAPRTSAAQAFGVSLLAVERDGSDLLVVGSLDVDRGLVILGDLTPQTGPPADPPAANTERRFDAADLPGDAVDPMLLGAFLAAGDLDGDSEPDLIVGDTAQVVVVYGPLDILPQPPATETISEPVPDPIVAEVFDATAEGFLPGGPSDVPAVFHAAALGDLDNDGVDDLVVSYTHESITLVTVLEGSPDGPTPTGIANTAGTGGVVLAAFDDDLALDAAFGAVGDEAASSVLVRYGTVDPGEIRVVRGGPAFESDGLIRHELVRENGADGPVSIAVTIGPGSTAPATAGTDFPVATQVVTWAPDEAGSKVIEFEYERDGDWENVETVVLAHGDPTGGINVPGPTTVSVYDLEVEAIEPIRLLDTRSTGMTIDMVALGGGANPAGNVLRIPVAGRGSVPSGATAVSLNLSVVAPDAKGYVTLFPCTATMPRASALNYEAGAVTGNGSFAKLSAQGELCIFTLATTHLVIDVNGYVPDGAAVGPIAPGRFLDTRPTGKTIDGEYVDDGPIPADTFRQLQITGRGDVPAGATSVMLNLTAVNPAARGHITVYPCTAAIPKTSSLNFPTGVTTGNGVVAKLGAGGAICLYAKSTIDVVVDVLGVGIDTKRFATLEPTRGFDSRPPFDPTSTIGRLQPLQPEVVDASRNMTLADGEQLRAVFVNITVVNPLSAGYVTLSSCGATVPRASAINFKGSQTKGNNAVVLVSPDETFCVTASVPTDVVIDIVGRTTVTSP